VCQRGFFIALEGKMAAKIDSMPEPGGFAVMPKGLLRIQAYIPESYLRVLMILISYGDKAQRAFPGQDKLAAVSRLSRQRVNQILGEMHRIGLVQKIPRYKDINYGGGQTSSEYYWWQLDDPKALQAIVDRLSDKFSNSIGSRHDRKQKKANYHQPVIAHGVDTGTENTRTKFRFEAQPVSTPCAITPLSTACAITPLIGHGVDTNIPREHTLTHPHFHSSARWGHKIARARQ
jgi:hypothetical protein